MHKKQYLIGLIPLLFCCAADAGLAWQETELQTSVSVEQAKVLVVFHFYNAGEESVEIVNIYKSCNCLSEELDKKRYAPGESGTMKVTVDLNGHFGPTQNSLMITTSDPSEPPKRLRVKVDIPPGYRFSEQDLIWIDPDFEPKSCRMINESSTPVFIESATSDNPLFSVELVVIREGFEYEVNVSPLTDSSPAYSTIRIKTKCPPELKESRSYIFKAIVREPVQ